MISNVDLVPTLLHMLDVEIPDNIQGRSLWGLIIGERYIPNEAIFAEKTYHTYYDPMRAIRTDRWKLIANFEFAPWQETSPDYENNAKSYVEISKAMGVPYRDQYHPPFELFDLQADPWEQHNLAEDPAYTGIRNELICRLRQWMENTGDPLLDGPMAQGAYVNRMSAFKKISSA
jgi:arylsulfatase A-like enzyme